MKLYDISVPISQALPVYPGDPALHMAERMRMRQGDPVNLLHISLGVHTATHMDAPHHVLNNGVTMDDVPLERGLGLARVLEFASDVQRIDGSALRRADLAGVSRVLFKTVNSALWRTARFAEGFVALTRDGAEYLVAKGIVLVGIDYLSVDAFDNKDLPAHHVLLTAGVAILEGINLTEVEPGDYELICLPLAIKGSDCAPARAILRSLPGDAVEV